MKLLMIVDVSKIEPFIFQGLFGGEVISRRIYALRGMRHHNACREQDCLWNSGVYNRGWLLSNPIV